MQNRQGYILFLLFSILSVCCVLISLTFSKVMVYRQFIQQSIKKQKTNQLAMSGVALAQALLTTPQQKDEQNQEQPKTTPQNKEPEQIILEAIFPYFNKEKSFELSSQKDGIQATISLSIQSEQGKLNLNSLYDFTKKQFMYEGKPNDRKKLSAWLFGRIATLTGKPSLMSSFEQHLKNRTAALSDVTELLDIKEFADQFSSNLFFNPDQQADNKIFLTDLFTVCSDQETITPWIFSQSWCNILNLKPKQKLSEEEIKKIFSTFKKNASWQTDWNNSLQLLYLKEYKDLPEEIKSILTTQYEANIFSLLLKAKTLQTTSTIFTIVKANTKQHLHSFDSVKIYQVD